MRIKLYNQFILEKKYDDKFGITPELESDINFQVPDYEINEGFNELQGIKGNLQDILVELVDQGFSIDVNIRNYDKKSGGSIYVYLENDDEFRVDDVKDYIMMLNDYMQMNFDKFKTLYRLDYMHSSGDNCSYGFEYFPDGNTTDIYNLLIEYKFVRIRV